MCLPKHLPLGDLVHDAKESYFQDSNPQSSKALVVIGTADGIRTRDLRRERAMS